MADDPIGGIVHNMRHGFDTGRLFTMDAITAPAGKTEPPKSGRQGPGDVGGDFGETARQERREEEEGRRQQRREDEDRRRERRRDDDEEARRDIEEARQRRRERKKEFEEAEDEDPAKKHTVTRVINPGPRIIHVPSAPRIVPVVQGRPATVERSDGGKGGISIRITNKAVINEKKRGLRKAKKTYNTLKRQTIKAIKKGRAEHYKRENEKIKKLPAKRRKAARTTLRRKLKERESQLVQQLPSSTRMKAGDLVRVTRVARKLRW
jgi:hypothetical protein